MSTGYEYTLYCRNDSTTTGEFCVFQDAPESTVAGGCPVAWLVKGAAPTTTVIFRWQVEPDFVWSETGQLAPGIQVASAQVWPADVDTENQVTFTQVGGIYTFQSQTTGPTPGTLSILQSGEIPADAASVGIGMAGAATFVVQAQPNITARFEPSSPPVYQLTFGRYTVGQALDPAQLAGQVATIEFPTNVYSMTAVLQEDNTWEVGPTTDRSASSEEPVPIDETP